MLLGKSTFEFVLIKAFVYFSSYLGLLCLAYFYLALSIGGWRVTAHPVSIVIEAVGAIEILFYLVWFLPYRSHLRKQKPLFPPPLSREGRRDLFEKSLAAAPDIELYIKRWMGGASLEDLRRENVKEWLLWALLDREGPPGDDDEELEGYVKTIEHVLERNIKPGKGPVASVRSNFRKLAASHRSLTYYIIIGAVDLLTSIILLCSGFSFYRQPRAMFLRTFPPRPLTLFAPKESASPSFSYFYRPHKSTTHRPVVFIHGLGVGLAPYIPFLLTLPKDIGVLAIEILPISSRITEANLLPADQAREIGDIITKQKIDSFVFIGHSYGTFFTKLFLETSLLASRMERIILIDPVAVLLHTPDLAYNATTRVPKHPNEIQITWAAMTEPDIAFNIAKRFCWRSHVLWREDLLKCPTTVVIESEDCLVNAEAIAAYVTKGAPQPAPESAELRSDLQWSWTDRECWKRNEWTGEGLELFWLEGYDHGQGFLRTTVLRNIVKLVERYCLIETVAVEPERELPRPPADDDDGSAVTAEEVPGGFELVSRKSEVEVSVRKIDSGTRQSV